MSRATILIYPILIFTFTVFLNGCPIDEESDGGVQNSEDAREKDSGDVVRDAGDLISDSGSMSIVGCEIVDSCGASDGQPSFRSEAGGVYDSFNKRMIIFGGHKQTPQNCGFEGPGGSDYTKETWAFHDACGVWKKIEGEQPSYRSRHMMAFDDVAKKVYLFGGRKRRENSGTYTVFNDFWALDVQTDTWTKVTTTNQPQARQNAAFIVDSENRKAYLFGGNVSASGASYVALNDLWSLDLENFEWTEMQPAGNKPDKRLMMGYLFDSKRKHFVIHAGSGENAFLQSDSYDDLWSYSIADNLWSQQGTSSENQPRERFWGTLAYDEINDKYLSFGGHDSTNLGNSNDLWSFDPESDTWSNIFEGDTYNKPANSFCNFPEDFAIIDQNSPERRDANVMVYSTREQCPGVIISMGKTDCGSIDDAWRYNMNENQWQELSEARVGEACLRADRGLDCSGMCQ